jgi:hypothetical protein
MSRKEAADHDPETTGLLEFAAPMFLAAIELLQYAALHCLSDRSLIDKLKAGQCDALTILFKRHHNLIHQFASRLLPTAAMATTLTQEVFIDIYHLRETLDPEKIEVKT